MSNSGNLAAIEKNNTLQGQVNDNLSKQNNVLDQQISQSKNALNKQNVDKINLERMAEVKTYYSLKYKAINYIIKVFFFIAVVIYVLIAFFGVSTTIPRITIGLIAFLGLCYIIYLYYDITLRDKRNFQEYNFGKPAEDAGKSKGPKKICVRTTCCKQGDDYNNKKNNTISNTQNNMLE